jgi:DNA replication licensing factor MCM5
MGVHMNAAVPELAAGDLDIQTMKSYISYCKSYVKRSCWHTLRAWAHALCMGRHCGPRLSPAAAERLSDHFVTIRQDVRNKEVDLNERSTIPITVRYAPTQRAGPCVPHALERC